MMRLLVLALLCVSCGRVGFEPLGVGREDASTGNTGDGLGPGGPVQSQLVTMDVTPRIVTIQPVDPTRSIVLCDYRTGVATVAAQPACELTDATTVTLTTGVAEPTLEVHVQVVQLPAGSVVQRGVFDFSINHLAVGLPLQQVDLASTFMLLSRWTNADSVSIDPQFSIVGSLTSSTSMRLARDVSGNRVHIAWQVVQLAGARVLAGQTTLGAGVFAASAAIPMVDLSRTFVVSSSSTATSSEEAEYMVATGLQSSTAAAFRRSGMATATLVSYFVVEAPDVVVTSGLTAMGLSLVATPNIGAIDPTRAAVFVSPFGGRAGNDSDVDETVVTGLIQPPVLALRRNTPSPVNVDGGVAWSVVEWQ